MKIQSWQNATNWLVRLTGDIYGINEIQLWDIRDIYESMEIDGLFMGESPANRYADPQIYHAERCFQDAIDEIYLMFPGFQLSYLGVVNCGEVFQVVDCHDETRRLNSNIHECCDTFI